MSLRRHWSLICLLSWVCLAGFANRPCQAARIEAVAGKSYRLTDRHGPWMVMVASFHSSSRDGETDEGKTPQQAADQLVYELRQKGVPAYTYEIGADSSSVVTRDRLGQTVERRNLRALRSVAVIAGNYPSYQDETAQQTLAWVKLFVPASLQEGVVFKPTPGRTGPLSGAFLTINPLVDPAEVSSRNVDPLLVKLNSGVRHSLSENKGPYTLVVAHFGGKTFTEVNQRKSLTDFLVDNDLNMAGEQAERLAAALRQDLDPKGVYRNVDAYVWHDRYESIVTVGSFASENDPAIEHYRRMFAASVNPASGQTDFRYLSIGDDSKNVAPEVWTFVPTPQVMRVPQIR